MDYIFCIDVTIRSTQWILQLLEIGSGTGQHVVHFAPHFPNTIFQPSDIDIPSLNSIAAYIQHYKVIRELKHICFNNSSFLLMQQKYPFFVYFFIECTALVMWRSYFDSKFYFYWNLIFFSLTAFTSGFPTQPFLLSFVCALICFGAL